MSKKKKTVSDALKIMFITELAGICTVVLLATLISDRIAIEVLGLLLIISIAVITLGAMKKLMPFDKLYRDAFIFSIFRYASCIIINLCSIIAGSAQSTIGNLNTVGFSILSTYCVITATNNLITDEKVQKLGRKTIICHATLLVIATVLTAFSSDDVSLNTINMFARIVIALVLLAVIVFLTISYIYYLSYLKKAQKLLMNP